MCAAGRPARFPLCRPHPAPPPIQVMTLVDLAGHERYFKTTAFGLTGHLPGEPRRAAGRLGWRGAGRVSRCCWAAGLAGTGRAALLLAAAERCAPAVTPTLAGSQQLSAIHHSPARFHPPTHSHAPPDYACLIVGANAGVVGMCKEHLGVALALKARGAVFRTRGWRAWRRGRVGACEAVGAPCSSQAAAGLARRHPCCPPPPLPHRCRQVPVFFVVTKVDLAPDHVLKHTLQTLGAILRKPGVR